MPKFAKPTLACDIGRCTVLFKVTYGPQEHDFNGPEGFFTDSVNVVHRYLCRARPHGDHFQAADILVEVTRGPARTLPPDIFVVCAVFGLVVVCGGLELSSSPLQANCLSPRAVKSW